MLILKVRNAQEAVMPLLRLLIDKGIATSVNSRPRLSMSEPFTLLVTSPTEVATALPLPGPNPFVRLAEALRTHAGSPHASVWPFQSEDPFDVLPKFEPDMRLGILEGEVVVHAGVQKRELLADLLTRDLLELGLMQEITAQEANVPCGGLYVTVEDLWLDLPQHGHFLEAAAAKLPVPELDHSGHVPPISIGRHTWREEAKLLLETEGNAMGLRERWHRKVSQPMLSAWVAHRHGEFAQRDRMVEAIADPAWRASVVSWFEWRKEPARAEIGR